VHVYGLADHGKLLADRVRMQAYREALRRTVSPGSVVVDVGAGVGIFALLACQLGARHVYAIEVDDVIDLAREIAAANGYGDRITFIQDLSTNVTLPERADVMVSDLRGVLPWWEKHIPAVVDARERLVSPGGRLIPAVDAVWASLVDAPELYEPVRLWDEHGLGVDLGHARARAANRWRRGRVGPDQLLVEPERWVSITYAETRSADAAATTTWAVARAGTAHGLVLWFDTSLVDGVGFSNAPGGPESLYGHAFFPLLAPVEVDLGDRISVDFRVRLVGADYIWSWKTSVSSGRRTKAEYSQSTFFALPLSPQRLPRHGARAAPLPGAGP
jgi:protein arginine N-methyltransferase 1